MRMNASERTLSKEQKSKAHGFVAVEYIQKCDLFSSRVITLSLQGSFTHQPIP